MRLQKLKCVLLALSLPFIFQHLLGQDKVGAEKLVAEGIPLHDKGNYAGAIAKYDKALALDKDNLLALSEKAISHLAQGNYQETIRNCEKAIAVHPGSKDLKVVYIAYGNAEDGLGNTARAIEIYDEGIKSHPDFALLYYNKGISMTYLKKIDEAILCFQKSISLNPNHASSHNALGRLLIMDNKKIPALLAFWRFLALEAQGPRAKGNLEVVLQLMEADVEETGKNSATIRISPEMLGDTTADGRPNENSFTSVNLVLAMNSALELDKKSKKKSAVEQFQGNLEMVCAALQVSKEDNYGFYWDYYAPYFIDMRAQGLTETFSYIAFASSDEPGVSKWIKTHEAELGKFIRWSRTFEFYYR